jgi:hypothetical protein
MFSLIRTFIITMSLLMCLQVTVDAAPAAEDDAAAIRRPLPKIAIPTNVVEQPAATFSNDIPPPPPLELEPVPAKTTKEQAP